MPSAVRIRAGGFALGIAVLWTAHRQPNPQPLAIERVAEDLYSIYERGGNVAAHVTAEGVPWPGIQALKSPSRPSSSVRVHSTPLPPPKNIEDLGWKPSPLFERSLPGLHDEVRI